jgi:flagellar assembly factor FliW
MKIESKPYGEIEIDSSKVVTLKGGLFGFEGKDKFVIVGKEEERPFEWLQSVGQPDLAFVIVQPQYIRADYTLSLLPEDYRDIEADSSEDIITYAIVVVPENPDNMTVNLKGPIVINQDNLLGKQVINQVEEYKVRHRVLDELESNEVEEVTAEGGA